MKKALLTGVLASVSAVAGALGLAACGGKGNDHASKNDEFVSYRKKVVSVLKDNEIFVNDLDAHQKSASAAVKQAARLGGNFQGSIMQDEYVSNDVNLQSVAEMVYALSLKTSLLIGDGIATYYNETKFFGITVSIAEGYYKVLNDGNIYNVLGYIPAMNGNAEHYTYITLDYKSQSSYEFTCLDWEGTNAMRAYGNSQKEMLVAFTDSDAVYTPDGQTFYSTNDAKIVSECEAAFGQLPAVDALRNMKGERKYTITDAQHQELSDKYFKELFGTQERQGIQYEQFGNKKAAVCFFETQGVSEVIIPSDVEYFGCDFVVYDQSGSVKTIKIPASVKGFVDGQGNIITDARDMRFMVVDDSAGTEKSFKNITVAAGSPLFESGSGHLKLKSGKVVSYADCKSTTLDMDDRCQELVNFSHAYKVLLGSVTTVNIDMGSNYNHEIMPLLTALTTVNITNKNNSPVIGLDLQFKNTLTVNVEIESTNRDYWLGVSIIPRASDTNNAKVTFNFNKICPIPYIALYSTAKPSVVINTCMSQLDYQLTFGLPENANDEHSVINYAGERDGDGLMVVDMEDYSKTVVLALSENFTSKEIAVPAQFGGYRVREFILDAEIIADKELKLSIAADVAITFLVPQEGLVFDNRNFVICTEMSYDELLTALQADYFSDYDNYDLTFTARCSDKTDVVQIGLKYNPDSVLVSVEYSGITKSVYTHSYGGDTAMIDLTSSFNFDFGLVYVLTDGENNYYQLNWEGEVRFNVPNSSASYKLYSYSTRAQTYNLKGEDYEFSFVIQFSKESNPEALVTGGTICGCPISVEGFNGEIENPDGSGSLRGIEINIFRENFITVDVGNATNYYGVTVRFFPDDEQGWKPVFETVIKRMVDVTLTDGTHIEVARYFYERMPFDKSEWKIEDGFVYFLMCTDDEGRTFRRNIYVNDGYLEMFEDVAAIVVKRFKKFDSISAQIEQDEVSLTVDVTMINESYFQFAFSGTALGHLVTCGTKAEVVWTHFTISTNVGSDEFGHNIIINIDFDFEITDEGNLIITDAEITKEII